MGRLAHTLVTLVLLASMAMTVGAVFARVRWNGAPAPFDPVPAEVG